MDSYDKVTLYRYRLVLEQVVIDRDQYESIETALRSSDDFWQGRDAFENLKWDTFSWGYSYDSLPSDGYGQIAFAGDMDNYGPWLIDKNDGADPPWVHYLQDLCVNDARQSKAVLDQKKERDEEERTFMIEQAKGTGKYPSWLLTPDPNRDLVIEGQVINIQQNLKGDS
tara:strand:- start:31 stop:537 length:507 start_codon:yes stop_codon:yes gene_type:complete